MTLEEMAKHFGITEAEIYARVKIYETQINHFKTNGVNSPIRFEQIRSYKALSQLPKFLAKGIQEYEQRYENPRSNSMDDE